MDYKCEMIEKKEQPTLSIRTRAAVQDLPQVLGSAYQKIMGYMIELDEQPTDAPFVIYYNMDMDNLDIEVGYPVSKKLPVKNYIEPKELPAGNYVQCIHIGPYSQVERAYVALAKWLEENNCESTGIAYEFYLNDPQIVPEDKLETRIMLKIIR